MQDTTDESDETFGVFLGPPTGSCTTTVGDGQGQGTIVDDDGTAPSAPGSVVIDGGKRKLKGSGPAAVPAACRCARPAGAGDADGGAAKWALRRTTPAQAGTHYVAASGTLTFAPGDTQEKAEVTALRSLGRRAAKFFVVLSDPNMGGAIHSRQGPRDRARPDRGDERRGSAGSPEAAPADVRPGGPGVSTRCVPF